MLNHSVKWHLQKLNCKSSEYPVRGSIPKKLQFKEPHLGSSNVKLTIHEEAMVFPLKFLVLQNFEVSFRFKRPKGEKKKRFAHERKLIGIFTLSYPHRYFLMQN